MADRVLVARPIRELAGDIASGTLSPVELAEACLDHFARVEESVRAFAHMDAELVRCQAEHAADEIGAGRYRGLLHGVPIGVKDLIDTADMPTRYGSPVYPDVYPKRDAAVVERLRAAGAVVFGKNTTQLDPYPRPRSAEWLACGQLAASSLWTAFGRLHPHLIASAPPLPVWVMRVVPEAAGTAVKPAPRVWPSALEAAGRIASWHRPGTSAATR